MQNCQNCGYQNADESAFCAICGRPLTELVGDTSQKGTRCDFCAKRVPYSEYFACRYCDKKLCSEHRLPENHLCKSTNMRRFVPGEASSASASYSYSSPYYRRSSRSTFSFNMSKQGKNLAILVLSGLGIGFVFSFINIDGLPVTDFLIQFNSLVYQGWLLPIATSIIVAPPALIGLEDVALNAIALVIFDRLLASSYTPRQYYTVFVASGVFGNVLSLVYGPNFASFGASGGIFGLIAGAVTYNYAVNRKVNSSLVMWFLVIFFLSSFTTPGVNWVAHLGGVLLGLPAGYYVGRKRRKSFA